MAINLLAIPVMGQTGQRNSSPVDGLLRDTEIKASSQHKNILLLFGASWCAPCHTLENFLNDPAMRPIFDRYFVELVVDYSERPDDTRHKDTPGADQLIDSLHDTGTSLPLIVMLNSSGQLIADSVRPVYGRRNIAANIGYPESPTAIAWFLEMLRSAAPSLTLNESQAIENWLLQHSTYERTESTAKR